MLNAGTTRNHSTQIYNFVTCINTNLLGLHTLMTLRIYSAHDLEIERGRYANTPRHERICTFCNTSMGAKIVDYESHMAYKCDLYADFKAKLNTRLNKSPPIENTHLNNPELTLFIDTTADIVNLHYKPLLTKSTVLIEQNLDYIDAPTLQTVYMYIVPTGGPKKEETSFFYTT